MKYTLLLSVHPTAPTPLKSYKLDDLCLTPSSKTCSPNDSENIIYARGDNCDGKHFQFTLESNGVLRHSCSGKMVCPTGSGNGASLVVSSSCLTNNSKFERTQGKTERHSKLKKKKQIISLLRLFWTLHLWLSHLKSVAVLGISKTKWSIFKTLIR